MADKEKDDEFFNQNLERIVSGSKSTKGSRNVRR